MSVLCEFCAVSGRGLCDGPIPRSEKSYRLLYVTVCDPETSRMRRPWAALGCFARGVGGKEEEEDRKESTSPCCAKS